jgi:hypothetical protein
VVCGGMLWKLFQGLVMFAILAVNIRFNLTPNGYIAGAWAFMGAYALTVFPFQIYDWWAYRHVRRSENARKKAAGIPYGWRRHLPRRAVSRSVGVLKEPVFTGRRRGGFGGKSGTDLRP